MKNKEYKLMSQKAVGAVINALNEFHSESLQTIYYYEDGCMHVHGHFWKEAVTIARVLNLSIRIVENHHIKIF